MKLASFDIFDTALIRRCGKPTNIFYLLADKLYPEEMAKREDFVRWRSGAEQQAHARGRQEVQLSDIYQEAPQAGFDEWSVEELMEQEMDIEAANLMANPAVIATIRQKRAEGFTICFISDMYLRSDFLRAILAREGCLLDDEPLYVSCEQGARKSTGALFRLVKKQLHPDLWEHYGDNRYSDVKVARRWGIKSQWVNTPYTDVEKSIVNEAAKQRSRYPLSILAGLSRSTSINHHSTAEAILAADFVAAAYVPYALFVLNEARRQGIKRLYFLSRDSYILMRALQKIAPADIELRYLFVSRQALFLPCMVEPTAECFLQAIDKQTVYRKYVDPLLHTLRTNREELATLGITFDFNHIETREQEHYFLDQLFHGDFVPLLTERIQASQQVLLAYFEQELLLDGTASAMVDVGWLGTSRLMINRLLRQTKHRQPLFFYFGIRKDVLPTGCGQYISYFPAEQLDIDAVALLESYCSASPYPTTIDYRSNDDRIEPVFPAGTSYTDTPITQTNIRITEQLIAAISSLKVIDEHTLYQWARLSLEHLVALKDTMDLSPISRCCGFGKEPLARKLTMKECCLLFALVRPITASDRISIYMTFGKRLGMPLLKYYRIGHKVKDLLYQKFIYKK